MLCLEKLTGHLILIFWEFVSICCIYNGMIVLTLIKLLNARNERTTGTRLSQAVSVIRNASMSGQSRQFC